MAADKLKLNNVHVNNLRLALSRGEAGMSVGPLALEEVMKHDAWRERELPTGKIVKFDRFDDFVTSKPMEGLGVSLEFFKTICKTDLHLLDAYDEASVAGPGNPTGANQHGGNSHNITDSSVSPLRGTDQQYSLRKLRKSSPELHSRVLSGELSPHAAMIQAGFRKKTITVPCDPDLAAKALLRHFDRDAIDRIIYLISLQRETP